jgi:hypothetical protein
VASSSKHEDEKEEKWLSLLNHIVNVHVHKDFELFRICTHEVLDREWLKPGMRAMHRQIFRFCCEGMPQIQGGGLSQRERYSLHTFPLIHTTQKIKFWFPTRFCSVQETGRKFNLTRTNNGNSEVIRLPPNIIAGSKTCTG